jgi:hypothetical protein
MIENVPAVRLAITASYDFPDNQLWTVTMGNNRRPAESNPRTKGLENNAYHFLPKSILPYICSIRLASSTSLAGGT